jgi:small conductance mechanosensitive channel
MLRGHDAFVSTTTVPALLDATTVLGALFYAVLVVALAWLVGSILNVFIHRYLDRAEASGADSTSVRFLGQLARVIVYVIAFALYAYLIPALHTLGTAWLASVGLFSVVIGLATQSTLSNLIAGISVILYRPFRVGDRIQVMTPNGPEIGVVVGIDLGYTSLYTSDGRRIVLPNSLVASQTNINFTRNSARMLLEVPITIASGENIGRAKELLLEAAKDVRKVTKVNGCFVTNVSKNGSTLMLSLMCLDPGDVASIKSDLLEEAAKRLTVAHIGLG